MVKRVRGTVRYHEENDDGELVRVTSEANAKLSDLPKEVQEQESVQELVYDDKEEDGPTRGHSTQVTRATGNLSQEERQEQAEALAKGEQQPKESKAEDDSKGSKSKSKDS